MSKLICVDVESDGGYMPDYSIVCFAAIIVEPSLSKTFYGKMKPISNKWNPEALQEIIYSAKNSGFTGTPFIFGSGEIYRYLSLADAAANTSDGGIDFAKFINGNSAAFMQSYKMHNALKEAIAQTTSLLLTRVLYSYYSITA